MKLRTVFFIIFTALILTLYQTLRVDVPNYEAKLQRHNSIITNSIEYPYSYRLLNPYMANAAFVAAQLFLPQESAFIFAYTLQSFIVYLFLLFSFWKFCGLWLENTGIIVSCLLLSVLVPLSLTGYDNIGDITTAAMMSLGFRFTNSDKINMLFPLIFIGSFNELQMILLAVFYFFGKKSNLKNGKVWITTILLIITFLVGYYIIYLLRGGEPLFDNFVWLYTKNTKPINDLQYNLTHPGFILLWVIMIVPLLLYAFRDFKNKPEFLRQSLIIVLPVFYVIAFLFIARMREIDKALTIFVILIPLAAMSLLPQYVRPKTQ